jgi:hypothetical protein
MKVKAIHLTIRSPFCRTGLPARILICASLVAMTLLSTPSVRAGSNASGGPSHLFSRHLNSRDDGDASALLDSRELWHEETYAALVARFWQWNLSIPAGVSPIVDTSGANCGINQAGPVWFLAAPGGKTLNNACTLPAGKAILSGLFDGYDDYPCTDPTFGPAQGQSLETFLQSDILSFVVEPFVSGAATLDGKPLKIRRVKTSLFAFTAAESLATAAFADTCITGSPQLAVADGYYVFIEPLRPGQHILHLQSTDSVGDVTDVTTTLTAK